jgi:hypothetical protein
MDIIDEAVTVAISKIEFHSTSSTLCILTFDKIFIQKPEFWKLQLGNFSKRGS